MNIFSVFALLGGLAFFLHGMSMLSSGLEMMVGSKLESVLKKMTSSRAKGLLLGAVITAIIQSSSAVTVMLVGLVNSGIMDFGQSIGVIMGTNIGTTITAWILSLTGIEGDNFILKMLKPESFTPIIALIGVILVAFTKSSKKKNLGSILVGFALLMTGMTMMSGAMKPLAEMPAFRNILTMFTNPFLGILAGTLITAIIQSSSASVGILQSIALTGSLTFNAAIPIIMGQNIGTCITALLSSIGTTKNAKRVTTVHILFNLIGTAIIMPLYYISNLFFKFSFADAPISAFQIAVVHSLFNLATTLLLFPLGNLLEKLAKLIIKDKDGQPVAYEFLDDRLLLTPSFAISECRNIAVKMASITKTSIMSAIDMLIDFDPDKAKKIRAYEEEIDFYEDKLGSFLVKLSAKELSEQDSNEVAELLHCIGDFERIADHALNLAEVSEEIHQKNLTFSPEAWEELLVITDAITAILDLTFTAFEQDDPEIAAKVEPLEQVIDGLKLELKNRHIKRLQNGKCTIELGFVLSDILTNYERISDHCSNIAVYIIQIRKSMVEAHEYLSEIRVEDNQSYMDDYKRYRNTYTLPQKAKAK